MRKNKKNKVISGIFILFAIFILITGLISCANKSTPAIETYKVQKGTIMQTVTSSGSVNASETRNFTLQASGEVQQVLAAGTKFKKGDVLIKVDNTKTQLLLSQAEENLKTAQNSIDIAKINYQQALNANHIAVQLAGANTILSDQATQNAFKALEDANGSAEASINNASTSIDNANKNLKEVEDSPISTDIQIAQAQGSVNSAEAAYEQAKANAQSQADTAEAAYKQALNNQSISYWNTVNSKETAATQIKITKKNIDQAEAQLELSKINLEIAKLDSDKSRIIAPFDGIILASNYNPGEFASPSPAVSIIGNSFVIKSDINETDITKIKIDQEADITLDAYPDKHFSGKVSSISPIS
jgi:multidrug resistance efflux pump